MAAERYVNVQLAIEECDERGVVITSIPAISVYLSKRLQIGLLQPEGIVVARQHQVREAVGEERDNGQFVGIAHPHSVPGPLLLKTAILDYIANRIGL